MPFPFAGDLPDSGMEPGPPALQADSLLSAPPGKMSREHPAWTMAKASLEGFHVPRTLPASILPTTIGSSLTLFDYLMSHPQPQVKLSDCYPL